MTARPVYTRNVRRCRMCAASSELDVCAGKKLRVDKELGGRSRERKRDKTEVFVLPCTSS